MQNIDNCFSPQGMLSPHCRARLLDFNCILSNLKDLMALNEKYPEKFESESLEDTITVLSQVLDVTLENFIEFLERPIDTVNKRTPTQQN